MTCHHHKEQEILLLAHGELSLLQSFRLRAHLRCCIRCRERYARLSAVSSALAVTLAAPGSSGWSAMVDMKNPALSRRLLLLLLCLFSLSALLMLRSRRPDREATHSCLPAKQVQATAVQCL